MHPISYRRSTWTHAADSRHRHCAHIVRAHGSCVGMPNKLSTNALAWIRSNTKHGELVLQGPSGDHGSRYHGTSQITWRSLFASHPVRASCPGEQGQDCVAASNRQSLDSEVQLWTIRSLMFTQHPPIDDMSTAHEEEAYDSEPHDERRKSYHTSSLLHL